MYFVYIFGVGVSYHHRKRTQLRFSCFSSFFLLWDYLIFVVDKVYKFLVVRLFLMMLYAVLVNINPLLPFIWLILGTTSPWVGSDFSCILCYLPRSWLAVESLCSSWFSKSGFWWSDFYVLFIIRGWLHSLLILSSLFFSFCSSSCCTFHCWLRLWWLSILPCLPLQVWIVFSFVYVLWAWKISCLNLELWFLCG